MEKSREVINCMNVHPVLQILAVGNEDGFTIYNYEEEQIITQREIGSVAQIGIIHKATEAYDKSCIEETYIAYVPGGAEASQKVNLYSIREKCLKLQYKVKSEVLAMTTRGSYLGICCAGSILFYDFATLIESSGKKGMLLQLKIPNVKGLISMNQLGKDYMSYFAYGSSAEELQGEIRVRRITDIIENKSEEKEVRKKAHEGKIEIIQFGPSGQLVCTASQKGTIIRVWTINQKVNPDSEEIELEINAFKELRRGSSTRRIKNISIDYNRNFLLVSSNSQYMHVFSLNSKKGNTKSRFSLLRYVNDYFDSEWSKLKIKIPEGIECFSTYKKQAACVFYVFFKSGHMYELKLSEGIQEDFPLVMKDMINILNPQILLGLDS